MPDEIKKKDIHHSLIKYIYKHYKKYPIYLILIILISIILGLYNSLDAYFKKILIDFLSNNIQEKNQINFLGIMKYIGPIISVYFFNHLFWRTLSFIEIKIAHKAKSGIISECFDNIHSKSYHFFQNNLSGSISHNIFILSDNIHLLMHKYFSTFLRSFSQFIFVFISLYFVNPIFSFIILVWMILFLSFSIFFLKKFRIASRNYAEVSAKTSGKIVDSIANFFNVKIFASQKFEEKILNKSLEKMEKKFVKKNTLLLIINAAQAFLIICSFFFTLFFIVKLKINGLITIGDCILILTLFLHISENIWWISEYIGLVNEIFGKCQNSLDKIFQKDEIKDLEYAKEIKIQNGEIEFKNVYFKYEKNKEYLFKNLSIKIQSGKKIGLAGFSGSGKSSFINLILRLYEIDNGEILIDSNNIKYFTQESLRSQISIIPQDPSLFHRSIFENIEYGLINIYDESSENPDIKQNKIINASKLAKADNFIQKCQNGYETFVGERGVKLSGGQKQRIAIARAILKNSQILILDEATSALDSITQKHIQDEFIKIMNGKTVIIIAHRLSTLIEMDEIFVFKDGDIVEKGTHNELIKNENGHYKEFWDMQINKNFDDE
jgi:ATP-binding cassette subfamily B protein